MNALYSSNPCFTEGMWMILSSYLSIGTIYLCFLDYLNAKHMNIEFTSEIEENGCLSFLDVAIQRIANGFETSVYRKPKFTGLTTKFTSYIPLQFKRNLVSTLVYRAFQISSSFFNFHKEINYLR